MAIGVVGVGVVVGGCGGCGDATTTGIVDLGKMGGVGTNHCIG